MSILGYPWLYPAISYYLRLSWNISGNLGLSQAISGYLRQFWAIWGYPYEVGAGESKLLLFENFFVTFFFTNRIYRGARAPKNSKWVQVYQDLIIYP